MILNTLYAEHKKALEGFLGGEIGIFLAAPAAIVTGMYYRFSEDGSAKDVLDKILERVAPQWDAGLQWDGANLPDVSDSTNWMNNTTFFLNHLVELVYGVENPEQEGLREITEPVSGEWYIAIVEMESGKANREYAYPEDADGVQITVKLDYTDPDRQPIDKGPDKFGLIGFYEVTAGFVFFDQEIGSLNIEDADNYRLLRH